ncbi:MAG: hypothetical protein JNN11_01530 [Candidatus Doudnabacteria bacterium]|nr:hypothetical protein [Candidatus Doudnabacteria bacterium]
MTKEEFVERKNRLPRCVVRWVEGWVEGTPWDRLELFELSFSYQAEVPEILPSLCAELARRNYREVEVKAFCWWGTNQRQVAVIFSLKA